MATPFNLKLTTGEGPVNFVTDKLKYTARRKPSQLSEIKAELQNETVHFESIAEAESCISSKEMVLLSFGVRE